MIRHYLDDETKVARVYFSGVTTPEDYEKLLPPFHAFTEKHCKIHVLLDLREWRGWSSVRAFTRHLNLVRSHQHCVSEVTTIRQGFLQKLAVLAGSIAIKPSVRALRNPDDGEVYLKSVAMPSDLPAAPPMVGEIIAPVGTRWPQQAIRREGKPMSAFIIYSHKDSAFLQDFIPHLKSLKGILDIWTDISIRPGDIWQAEIWTHLREADVIVPLLSADLLDSEFVSKFEWPLARDRHLAGQAFILPVLVRSVFWQSTPFSIFQLLPSGAKPVKDWPDSDHAWTDVVRGIYNAIVSSTDRVLGVKDYEAQTISAEDIN